MQGPTVVSSALHTAPRGETPEGISLEPDGGERLHFLGDSTMRLKLDGSANPSIAFYEYVSGPGVSGPPQHVHHGHDETFYVVGGSFEFMIGTERIAMGPGSFLYVPRDTPHTFRNDGDGPGCIVGTFNPPRFADYFRELAAIICATGGPPDRAAWAELYDRFDTTFYEPVEVAR